MGDQWTRINLDPKKFSPAELNHKIDIYKGELARYEEMAKHAVKKEDGRWHFPGTNFGSMSDHVYKNAPISLRNRIKLFEEVLAEGTYDLFKKNKHIQNLRKYFGRETPKTPAFVEWKAGNRVTTKEIAEKEDEIADFSELGEFIDYPMKTYSTGMYSRLGFSVVTHMDPDILLIDEALSAGDASFRDKAARKIEDMMEKARAIILVSHGLQTINEMASKCLWIDHGRMMGYGPCDEIVGAYEDFVAVGSSSIISEEI